MKKIMLYSVIILLLLCIFSASIAAAIASDDFNSLTLNESLWTIIDPRNDSTFSMVNTGSPYASFGITIPGGTSHDVSDRNWAPRIMQTADNSDFEVEVKFQSVLIKTFQMQGIIIEQDKDNFIRLEFYSYNQRIYAYAANINSGAFSQIKNTDIGAVSNNSLPLYMRVKRIGNQWTQNYSFDGTHWIEHASFDRTLTVTKVGPFVGNADGTSSGTSSPAFTGFIDYFFNTSSPTVPEDVADAIAPRIMVWYGNSQSFGQIGIPQQWVNIPGNVYDESGVTSFNYSLNNGTDQALSIGPDTRLESSGDFNVEIKHTDLLCGNNQVVLKAKDTLGNSGNQNVSINYSCNNVWPLPYSINWSNSASIPEVSQIVDGLWTKEATSIHPAIIGYDRLVDIGDMTWRDYEITAPITINTLGPSSSGPNFGFITRWQGHWDWRRGLPSSWQFKQPRPTWYPLGALGVYIWVPTLNDYRLRIIGNNMALIADDTSGKHLDAGVPYMFKMSTKTDGTGTLYTLKVWQKDQSESTAVTISGYGPTGELKQGSVLLAVNNANVSFGDISIRSLSLEDPFPVISGVSVEAHEFNATVRWNTSKTASSNVTYGLSTAYENGSVVDGNMVYSHAIILNGLKQNTVYHYMINSTDTGGNSTNTEDLTFTTIAAAPPLIIVQPINTTAINGLTATFSVVASGTVPLSYQWMKNGVDITHATGSSYTIPTVSPSDNNIRYSVLISNLLGSVTSNEVTLSVIEQPIVPWCDTNRRFRVPVTIDSAGFERYEKPVDLSLNFTEMLRVLGQTGTFDENSTRVVETDISGAVCSPVPSQFDKDPGFNAQTKASGTVVFIMDGTTQANRIRYYQVYFGLTGGSYSSVPAATQVTINDNIMDEGQLSYRINASGITYNYQKQAGGFSSLVDSAGNDWINYSRAVGTGEYRGIPNVKTGGIFHPGWTCCTSSIVTQGPLKIRVRSVSPDGKWESLWDFYPRYTTMTMVKAASNYWWLYEGTPGGILEPDKDFMVRPNNTKSLLSDSWDSDLPTQEWVYFSDPTVDRSLFVSHHEDDTMKDSYWPFQTNVLTVFGFGRTGTDGSMGSGQRFTMGLMDGTEFSQNSRTIYSAYKDLGITKGVIEQYDSVMTPTIVIQPSDRTVLPGVSSTFVVSAKGQLPLSYQWQKNDAVIPGATNALYTTPSTIESDNGSKYRVVVTNAIGSTTSDPAKLTVYNASLNKQLVLLDVNYIHNTEITKIPPLNAISGKASSFFNFQPDVPGNFVLPTNYAQGTIYQRLEVLNKQSAKTVKYQICVFQDNITTAQHACTNRELLAFSSPGTYYATQSMQSLFQYGNLNWTRKLLIMMLDITDKNGNLIDDRPEYKFNKTFDGEPDLSLYYPMKVRYTSIIVHKGGGAPVWPPDSPPGIITSPTDQITTVGDTVTFSVAATGTGPLYYQWQKNGVNIDGAYSSSYTIPPATSADNRSTFHVVVTNALGSATSNGAALELVPPINIIQNPGFETGTTVPTLWTKYQLKAVATLTKVSPGYEGLSFAKLGINSITTNPDIQLYQNINTIPLEPNTRYRLSFTANSTTGHDVTVKLIKAISSNPTYGLNYTANLSTSWNVFTTEFNTTGFTSKVTDGRLQFQFGQFAKAGDIYYLDNVSLAKVITASDTTPPLVIGNTPTGSSGGGGGGASGENYTNIEVSEKYDLPIYKDKVTSYRFTNVKNPILYVNITGNVSTEVITTTVEVLKNTSTLVTAAPPGTTYKNANVWVGTKGFATPRNIKEGIVRFRIETSWMADKDFAAGDIKLLRWDESKWVTLETTEKDKDSAYTYFEGKTNTFSSLSIVGLKEITTSASPIVSVAAPTITAGIPVEVKPSLNWAIILVVLLMIGIVIVLYLQRKGKSR